MKPFSDHPLYAEHNIDTAINSLWSFYKKNFVVLFSISLILSLITGFASSKIDLSELQSVTDPQELLSGMREYIWPALIITVISLFFYNIIHYYVIYHPLEPECDIFTCFVRSLRYFIPYLIILVLFTFLGSFILLLGVVAFVIGVFFAALYIFMIFLFILPVLMAEGPLIAHAIVRTFKLSHTKFWTNMGWTAAFGAIFLVISVILSAILLLPFTGSFIGAFTDPENAAGVAELTSKPLYILFSAAISALTFPLVPLFAVILYFTGTARENPAHNNNLQRTNSNNESPLKVEDLYALPPQENDGDKNE